MEWWEYLIVFMGWLGVMQMFVSITEYDASDREGQEINRQKFMNLMVSLCLLLLLLITYKLFFT